MINLVSLLQAGATSGTSLLPAEVKTMITGFASSLIPTVMELLGIIVPVGLTLWAIGFGVKKGMSYLQKRANKTT